MKIKYIPIFTDDMERQASYFAENLGFEVYNKKNVLSTQECIVMKTTSPDIFILITEDTGHEHKKCQIVVNTDDCLNDYYILKSAGIHFYNEPQYLPIGLGVEFMDPSGNRCLLIEERSYNNLT